MKVGARLTVFNWRMRERRAELGLTQGELAMRAGCHPSVISSIELLKPVVDWPKWLPLVADVLEVPVDEIFPPDYIEYLRDGTARRSLAARRGAFVREISLDQLGDGVPALTLDAGLDDDVVDQELKEAIADVLATLTEREAEIIRLRFGMDGREEHTMAEAGKVFGITMEHARRIEAKALRRLRHPARSTRLRELGPYQSHSPSPADAHDD